MEFNTSQYKRSHGKTPRGRGSWAFFFDRSMRIEDVYFTPSCTYAEAKKFAREEAKRRYGTCHADGVVFVGS